MVGIRKSRLVIEVRRLLRLDRSTRRRGRGRAVLAIGYPLAVHRRLLASKCLRRPLAGRVIRRGKWDIEYTGRQGCLADTDLRPPKDRQRISEQWRLTKRESHRKGGQKCPPFCSCAMQIRRQSPLPDC